MSGPHPTLFVVGAVVLVVLVVVIVVGGARAERAERRELVDLPVPDGASRLQRAEGSLSSHRLRGADPRRDGQLAAQERAARDALRCSGGRVDVAPVRCPVRDQGQV